MTTTIEFEADLEALDSGADEILSEMYFHPTDDVGEGGKLSVPVRLFPTGGRYYPSTYTLTVTFSRDRRGADQSISTDRATFEAAAELVGVGRVETTFKLFDPETRDAIGWITYHGDEYPDWLADRGDRGYVAIELVHERERETYSEDEIEDRRDQFREQVDQFEEDL